MRYRTFPTTADLGVFVYGKTREEVFENLAYALRKVIAGRKKLHPAGAEIITLEFPSLEMGLFLWASELLFLFDFRRLLPLKAKITQLGQGSLRAEVELGKLKSTPSLYIKAITMHRLSLEKTGGRWRASLVLDL